MARNLQVNEQVYVPRTRIGISADAPSAFYRTTVLTVSGRSVEVQLPNGQPQSVAASAVRRNIGVLVLRIGDFDTEDSLLDPMAKSILQYCRLLLDDDMVRLREVRSVAELQRYWTQEHAVYTHVVILAHGREDAVHFGVDGWRTGAELGVDLSVNGVGPKTFVSLACKTGYAGFGKPLSNSSVAKMVIAPFHSVHGALASQFCQTLLAYNLLAGETIGVAFKHARAGVAGSPSFRLWQGGVLKAGPK